ncbi:MAG TPA: ABC transporter ATP-binding protein [Thermoanaerobaculia bacterium]|nr:ABC transporter ATP-binding protein [Thermoanaerobaculia bacterium]
MNKLTIEATGLSKTYKTTLGRRPVQALDGVDLDVREGELFGLLGPNGAGKTTTVKILLGLTRATTGSARLLGLPVDDPESRRRVGYLPEGHRFPGYLTARETLSIFGRMSGTDPATIRQRMTPLLERLRIAEWMDVRVKKFSKGMTQRLGLASALIHDPDVLLLDEPTDGVDPVGRREIRDLLREEASRGKTIFVNSHLLSEIELTCDRVMVLRKGRVAAAGRIADLTATESRYKMVASGLDDAILASLLETGAAIESANGHHLLTVRDREHLNELIDRLRSGGALLTELAPLRSTLEDVFVGLVEAPDLEKPGARR